MQLKDKRALVTGASGGIGQAIVATIKDHGAIVTGTDMTPVEADFSIEGDLTNGGFCDQLPLQASNAMGGLDISPEPSPGVMNTTTTGFTSKLAITTKTMVENRVTVQECLSFR